ncbi:PREDICTED: uncharacterized protein LOC108765448 [Trachymyrmex cornetzi]|uniref:uncharacterized protein LOC108765448 n=1 Tax=Trachymyrmex cornetzi TaxID=471704 RepID=UPI00084F14C8|nr:PREDICTED: uncharacterized protein LOC108765448 [Trachymyrmex cornetzi]
MAEQGATYFREVFPVRRWIRRHYTKIPGRRTANCKHCPDLVPIRPSIMLHDHLVKAHSNELTEDEKKDKLTYWVWDHFTIKDTQYATCNICGSELKSTIRNLHQHLKFVHGILPPCTDDMDNVSSDANPDTIIKKDQLHSATSTKISKNTEQIGVLDKNETNRTMDLSLRRDVQDDVSDLSVHDIDTEECLSFPSQSSSVASFDIDFCKEVFDLFTKE